MNTNTAIIGHTGSDFSCRRRRSREGQQALRLAALAVIGLSVQGGLLSQPAAADPPAVPSYLYGIDDSNDIWQANPKPGEQSFDNVYPTGLTYRSNAFAFDRDRDQMFFLNRGVDGTAPDADALNNLWMWNKPLGTFSEVATGAAMGIAGITLPANAAYYANAFWFVNERTNDLVRASLVYGSADPGTVPTFGSAETFTITPAPALGPAGSTTTDGFNNFFGDIAITDSGILYASTAHGPSASVGANFYSLNLATAAAGTVGGFTMIKQGTVVPGTETVVGMQIAFSEDYTVLYGQNYDDGKWYSIDTTDGTLTDLNFATLIGTGPSARGFRDIGGASIESVPEPGAIALAAMGVAVAGLGLARRGRCRRVFDRG
jgi:hypothetical protein